MSKFGAGVGDYVKKFMSPSVTYEMWYKDRKVPSDGEKMCIDIQGSLYYDSDKIYMIKFTNGHGKPGETGGTTWNDTFYERDGEYYLKYMLPCLNGEEPMKDAGALFDNNIKSIVTVLFCDWSAQNSKSKNYEKKAVIVHRDGKYGYLRFVPLELPKGGQMSMIGFLKSANKRSRGS